MTEDGQVYAWGYNHYGQLGDGTNQSKAVPTLVSGLSNVASVTAGDFHSLAVTEDGQVYAWGSNGQGQLGDGTWQDKAVPTPVSGLSNVEISYGSSNWLQVDPVPLTDQVTLREEELLTV